MDGINFGESARWYGGRFWFADWAGSTLYSIDEDGNHSVEHEVTSFPFCFDWLPDGRMVISWSSEQRVVRVEDDGSMVTHTDLRGMSEFPWNEIVVHPSGNAYVNNIGYDMASGADPSPGLVACVGMDGSVRQVVDDVQFPNGMAITPDGSTLILAESHSNRLTAFDIEADGSLSGRRTWADVDGPPDGICLDADGAVWYADVPNKRCVRVAEGGEVLDEVAVDRGCFSCALGGADGKTLLIMAMHWDPQNFGGPPTGVALATRVGVPGIG